MFDGFSRAYFLCLFSHKIPLNSPKFPLKSPPEIVIYQESLKMERNPSDQCEKHLPKWLHVPERIILSEKCLIHPKISFIAVITTNGHLYEFWNKEILMECSLEASGESFAAGDSVSLDIFYSYEEDKGRRVFYLIRSGEKLFVVERLKDSLSLREVKENVSSVVIEDKSGDGYASVWITKSDGTVQETTFRDSEVKDEEKTAAGPSAFLLSILESHNRMLESDLEGRRKVIRKELHRIQHVAKYGPPEMHDGAPDEAAPVVKYGEVWTKHHNDRVIFGIPIFNTTYSRRRVALNVRPSLANTQLDRFSYEFKLYKIRSDSCTFENVDELFDCEEPSYANATDFQHEWMPLEENHLQPGLSAILVVNADVMDFSKSTSFTFNVFVQYEIKHEGRVYALQFMAGQVEITEKILFEPLFGEELEEKKFFYRNLLAIASTSSRLVIHIESGSSITRRFYHFLVEDLKFHQITPPEISMDVEMSELNAHESHLPTAMFYHRDDFLRGAVIRVKEINNLRVKLKVYMRTDNHLACFLRAIRSDFGNDVTIIEEENRQILSTGLQSLMDEINSKRKLLTVLSDSGTDELKCRESLEEIFQREFKTNNVYQKLSGK